MPLLALPVAPCWRCVAVGLGGLPLFTPLHGLRVSRYGGGDAVRRSPRRVGLQPTIGHQVVEVGRLLPRPASPKPQRLRFAGTTRTTYLQCPWHTAYAGSPLHAGGDT